MGKHVKRNYGLERNLGDIIYNKKDRTVFCKMSIGFFSATVGLVQRKDGCYDITKNIGTKKEPNIVKIAQTFVVKNKKDVVVEGLTQTMLPLISGWNKNTKKIENSNADGLSITTHKLKESVSLKDGEFIKVGYITGNFAIEVTGDQNKSKTTNMPPEVDIDDDEIPF